MRAIHSFCPPHFKLLITECQSQHTAGLAWQLQPAPSSIHHWIWSLLARSEPPLFAAMGESQTQQESVSQRRAAGKTGCRHTEWRRGWRDVGLRPLHRHSGERPIRRQIWSHLWHIQHVRVCSETRPWQYFLWGQQAGVRPGLIWSGGLLQNRAMERATAVAGILTNNNIPGWTWFSSD